MPRRIALSLLLLLPVIAAAQARVPVTLRSGPMIGATDMREVTLWAQTTGPARVRVIYWDSLTPRVRLATADAVTRRDSANVARLVADQVEAGHVYHYVLVDGRAIARP